MVKTAQINFTEANKAYENWLRKELHGEFLEADLKTKWEKMARGPFPFLRATYWRWSETILDICPELKDAPQTLAVGDIHLENYGVWRDDDGRLAWGVNDFDEAAEMPYALDLVRLAASATLARPSNDYSNNSICEAILEGYGRGLESPHPFVLDEDHGWLRKLLIVPELDRARFWTKIASLRGTTKPPADRYRTILESAMPGDAKIAKYTRRTAGTGSLGRPRWVGIAEWRGGTVLREAKALVPSAWVRVSGRGSKKIRCLEIASGRYRAHDPWYDVRKDVVVRRLSPNSRKIEVVSQPDDVLHPRMLSAMGHELANLHAGTGNNTTAIRKDLAKRKPNWLRTAARAAASFVAWEFKDWMKRR